MVTLSHDFFKQWGEVYDRIETDEDEYQHILKNTESEIVLLNNISKKNFLNILNWKSPRLKGKVNLSRFELDYSPAFIEIIRSKSKLDKIKIITSLRGIAVPAGSTILHFIYPNDFPIMDIRTAEALCHFNILKNKARTITNYSKFSDAINELKINYNISLRAIDRALFSYHKIKLNKTAPKIIKNINNAKENINKNKYEYKSISKITLNEHISESHNMSNDEYMDKLSRKYIEDKNQRKIFMKDGVWTKVRLNYIAGLILTIRGIDVFTPKDLREIIKHELIPSLEKLDDKILAGLILTNDVHTEAKMEYNNGYTCLEKIGFGKYKFIGFKV